MNTQKPELDFSEWLHSELVREYAKETESWALARVNGVRNRLNNFRTGKTPLTCTILWCTSPLAFTQGKHVYMSRRLLERLKTDDAVAFVLAHEAAHHDLGHLDLFSEWSSWLPRSRTTAYVATLIRSLEHWTYGPDRENDADDFGLRLSARSGFSVDLAVDALQTLEDMSLDAGDISGVYGPENLLDPTDPHRDSRTFKAQEWVWTHLRGYYPLRKRLERAKSLATAIRTGRDRG